MIHRIKRFVFLCALTLVVSLLFSGGRVSAAQDDSGAAATYMAYLPFVTGTAQSSGDTTITLNGDSIVVNGDDVSVDGTVATITAAGTYVISGTLNDGQIIVDTDDEETVNLTLNAAAITSSTSAPLAVLSAEETIITLADGTTSYLTDAVEYVFPDAETDEPNAALFSNDPLVIGGSGSLVVDGNYNDAISSDDSLTITGGTYIISAADDGLRGKDALVIEAGDFTLVVGGDALKSDNEDDTTLGTITISGGSFDVTAAGDGLAAETTVTISGGEFTLVTGGGSNATLADDDSAKGIKAGIGVTITGGTFDINAADDGINSNSDLTIDNGVLTIASGDDALHSDATLTINDGTIDITQSVEGIESVVITINDGDISVVSSDDGINVAGDLTGVDYRLFIHGGTIVVNASGDGIDVNGAIEMTGGVVLVHGPTAQDNGAIDYDEYFKISGGLLVATGSSGMAQAPGTMSTQNSVLVRFGGNMGQGGTQPAGTLVHIQNSAGEDILTFAPAKAFQSIVFSSSELLMGSEYTIYLGGSSTGTVTGGLYSGGTYTPGTQYASFTVNSVVTIVGGGGPPMPIGTP